MPDHSKDSAVLAAHVREVPDVVEPVHSCDVQHNRLSNLSMKVLRLL